MSHPPDFLHGSHLPNSCVQDSSISLVLNKPWEHGFTVSPIFSSGLAFVHWNLIILCSYIIINYDGLNIFTLVCINASFILTRNTPHRVSYFISTLKSEFAFKDHWPLHYFLGIEATHLTVGLYLSYCQYICLCHSWPQWYGQL